MKLQRKKFALNFNGLTSAHYTCGKGTTPYVSLR
nr:MAG TPA: hypothetical protein [Caudoviricetes sp.]